MIKKLFLTTDICETSVFDSQYILLLTVVIICAELFMIELIRAYIRNVNMH